jgi:hypothetical protein
MLPGTEAAIRLHEFLTAFRGSLDGAVKDLADNVLPHVIRAHPSLHDFEPRVTEEGSLAVCWVLPEFEVHLRVERAGVNAKAMKRDMGSGVRNKEWPIENDPKLMGLRIASWIAGLH